MKPGHSWKTCWCDQRNRVHHRMIAALVIVLILTPIAYADAGSSVGPTGWQLIAIMLIQALIGFIYVSGQRDTKASITKLFEKVDGLGKEKLDKEDCRECIAKKELNHKGGQS